MRLTDERKTRTGEINRCISHLQSGFARNYATSRVAESLKTPFIDLGSNKNEWTKQPVMLVSNNYNAKFSSCHDESVGILCTFSSDSYVQFKHTVKKWVIDKGAKTVVSRDAMHNPKMW